MSTILYIKASPREDRSYSIAVADAFVDEYLKEHNGDVVRVLDVFKDPIPEYDLTTVTGKYRIMHQQPYSDQEKQAWSKVVDTISEFKSADKYVMAVPMWNFSIPYQLKHYIDIIVQPTLTFNVADEGGYVGLVKDRPVYISYARGGDYPAGTEKEVLDHQKKYLELMLGFIGITDIKSTIVQPTLMQGADVAVEKKNQAIEQAKQYARNF